MIKRMLACVLTLMLILFTAACGSEGTPSNEISIPSSSKDFEGEHFQDVVDGLTKAGFTNVEPKSLEDLITGWLKKEGSVETVEVDGSSTFSSGSKHPKDAEIVVSYHSFKPDGDETSESESPTDHDLSSPAQSTKPEPVEEILTVANNEDLAALLASTDAHNLAKEFVAKYQGRTIEFDGNIAHMMKHGNYKTRYDILIYAGDSDGPSIGPPFQFNDVNVVSDLRLTGSNIPETIGQGLNLHIIATVEKYNAGGDLVLIKPVSTEVR